MRDALDGREAYSRKEATVRSIRVVLLLLSCIAASSSCAPGRSTAVSSSAVGTSPKQVIARHAIPLRTIDPADENWSDLNALAPRLRGVRLVLLGEATHGDGAAFLAKTRLVKFLHQRLGFDLVVFESGFYECSRAWPPTAGVTGVTAFENCAWAMWSQRRELEPLIAYLDRTRTGPRPLALAGLDPDIGVLSQASQRANELRTLLGTLSEPFVNEEQLSALLDLVDHAAEYRSRALPPPSTDSLRVAVSTAERLAAVLRDTDQVARKERLYWALVLENLAVEVQARFITRMYAATPPDPQAAWEANLARDEQMASNLHWLMEEAYPGSRVIVWVSTMHAARQLSKLSLLAGADEPTPFGFSLQELFNRRQTLGDHLRDRFGSSMYSIGISAGGGTTAGGPSGRLIPEPSSGSLEHVLIETGHEYSFLDLRNITAASEPRWVARPIGYTEMRSSDWSSVLDAILFIRMMQPSTPK